MVSILFATTASAQRYANSAQEEYDPTVYLISVQETDAVYDCCNKQQALSQATQDYLDTHRFGFQQAERPQFIFSTSNNKFSLALGGYVAMRASYDMDGISDNRDFVPYDIPIAENYNNRQQLIMDASTSRVYLKSIANTRALGRVVIFMDADFRGGSSRSYTPRLRSAYISFLGFTLGRDITTFCDLQAAPRMIDFRGPNAYNYNFATMVRYAFSFADDVLSMGVAAEMPEVSATYNYKFLEMRQRIPDIPVYLQAAWGPGRSSHLRASAVFRNMYVRNDVVHENKKLFGWGVQLSGTIGLGPWFRLFMNGVYGQGITPYIQDLTGSGLDFVPDNRTGEEIKVMKMWGWQAAGQINFTRRLSLSGGFSMVEMDRDDAFTFANEYKRGTYIFGNIFYALTPRCSIGAEYLYGSRKNMNAAKNHANRVSVQLQYNF